MDEIDPDPDNLAPMVSCGELNEEVPPHTPVDCRKIITYSRRTGTGLPMPLQPYQTLSDEPCNADRSDPASTRTSGKPDSDNTTGRPIGHQNYLENNHVVASSIVDPDLQLRLTRQKIARDLVSEDFAMYLENVENTDEAICLHLRELGIDIDAWEEAVDAIGWYDAFLSICVINRNRFHQQPRSSHLEEHSVVSHFSVARANWISPDQSPPSSNAPLPELRHQRRSGVVPMPDTPEANLWMAVLHAMVQDMFSTSRARGADVFRHQARVWLDTSPRRDFALVCNLAGVDPEITHETLTAALERADAVQPPRSPKKGRRLTATPPAPDFSRAISFGAHG